MTLDVLSFIDSKGGNSAEIKESQKKRGLSVELVDEIIQMYSEWVKSKFLSCLFMSLSFWKMLCVPSTVDYETNALRKKINEVQKEISAKKKVDIGCLSDNDKYKMTLNRQKNLQMILFLRRRRSMPK